MILKYLAGPVIGMIIGYFTNWLAVRMLFRPREAKYLAGHKLPFTPGVIPRGKDRIAGSVREIINTQLLTEDALAQRLTSDEITSVLRENIRTLMEEVRADQRTIYEYLCDTAGEQRVDSTAEKIEDFLTGKILQKLKEANLGKTVSEAMMQKLREALSGSFLGKMFGDSMMSGMTPAVEKAVNDYIDENGEETIRNILRSEKENLYEKTVGETAECLDRLDIDVESRFLHIYTELITKKSGGIIRHLDIGSIAEKAILDMSSQQLEDLVMSAMKTELRAVINLGALIGFILGLINLFIYIV